MTSVSLLEDYTPHIPQPDFDDDFSDDEESDEVPEFHTSKPPRELVDKLPQKRYPVFPLLPEPFNPKYTPELIHPKGYQFQFTHVTKVGNFKYIQQLNEHSLERLVDEIDEGILKESKD